MACQIQCLSLHYRYECVQLLETLNALGEIDTYVTRVTCPREEVYPHFFGPGLKDCIYNTEFYVNVTSTYLILRVLLTFRFSWLQILRK